MTIEEEEKDEPHMRRLWITCDVLLQKLLWTNPETLEGSSLYWSTSGAMSF